MFAGFPPGFYFVIAATIIILFLAANTAFNGFPVLGSILARDGYLPRQLYTRGDRLAYSNGIVVLAVAAIVLIVAFQADVTALIQLYVVGVFVSFTVSQTRHAAALDPAPQDRDESAVRAKMKRSRVINAIGLTMTGTGAGDRAAVEVPAGRLHRDHRHGRAVRDDEGHPPALQRGRQRDRGRRGRRGSGGAEPGPGHRAGQQGAQADAAGARVRQGVAAQSAGGADGRRSTRTRRTGWWRPGTPPISTSRSR